jgi:hypothetical protein
LNNCTFKFWTIVIISFLFFRHIHQPAVELFPNSLFPLFLTNEISLKRENLNELNFIFEGCKLPLNDKVFGFAGGRVCRECFYEFNCSRLSFKSRNFTLKAFPFYNSKKCRMDESVD